MQFEFTATVDKLDYETEVKVEKQALAHLSAPDMLILILVIGIWRQTDDGKRWQTEVTATVDAGRDSKNMFRPGTHAVVWPHDHEKGDPK